MSKAAAKLQQEVNLSKYKDVHYTKHKGFLVQIQIIQNRTVVLNTSCIFFSFFVIPIEETMVKMSLYKSHPLFGSFVL